MRETLTWVIVAGAPRHVSDFAGVRARERPAALCPQCGRRLILKLGRVRRHHAAHEAGWTCPAIRAETALHIACKLSLATTLRRAIGTRAALTITQRCGGAGCDSSEAREWLRDWDEVHVELRVAGERRPDIVLTRGGAAIGAIEILATNAVSPEKAASLEMARLPWIEVMADDRLARPGGWSPAEPLDVVRADGTVPWRCARHAREDAEQRELERESTVLHAARVVDIYHSRGSRERVVYRILELCRDGRRYGARLSRGKLTIAESETIAELSVAFRADVDRLCGDAGGFSDSPMGWANEDAAEFIVNDALLDRVSPDPTVLATTYPRRWFYAPATGRWFLPADMRGVTWDRPQGDVFGVHPAWHGARGAVRERPAPEGSWQTPIFAQRPIAAMFSAGIHARPSRDGIAVIGLTSRAIVVVERAVERAAAVDEIAQELDERRLDAIWISHPRDWRPMLERFAWTPAGRDQRGRGAVLIDGLGVFRADAFARALAKGDARLTAEAIRRASRRRIEVLSP